MVGWSWDGVVRIIATNCELESMGFESWQGQEVIYRISRTIRRTMIFSLAILKKNNDECILILVIYWKKTGLVHTKISNHNIIYSS